MGGPCYILKPDAQAPGRKPNKRVTGPPCTDNFQVREFEFEGKMWQSVEQCYQAMKYVDEDQQEVIRTCIPYPKESDWDYGLRVWKMGQARSAHLRLEWETVKVEYMYKIVVAKYVAHPDMQSEILSTGEAMIIGTPSTSNWQLWNGLIQTRVRKEIREGILGKNDLSGKDLEATLMQGRPKLTPLE